MQDGWLMALLGGFLIGTASALLLYLNGRIFGVSGILAGALQPKLGEGAWRYAILLGLLAGGGTLAARYPQAFDAVQVRPLWAAATAGLLVGFGTRMAGGCTSGHGVCGVGRLSHRSIVATATFIAAGILTATVFGMWG